MIFLACLEKIVNILKSLSAFLRMWEKNYGNVYIEKPRKQI